jgi:hypothetical protein
MREDAARDQDPCEAYKGRVLEQPRHSADCLPASAADADSIARVDFVAEDTRLKFEMILHGYSRSRPTTLPRNAPRKDRNCRKFSPPDSCRHRQ